jgi:2'-5' RNA ligase
MEEWEEWQRDFVHGTFVIWPPDPVRNVVNRLRERYDPISQRICEAHITLTQPFLRPASERDWQEMRKIVSGFEPFAISYGPLNTFLPYPCIYFEIHPAPKVLALRSALHAMVLFNLELPHTDDFIPHMSINDGRPDAERTLEIFETLKSSVPGGSFKCAEITYIKPDASFHFDVTHVLPLKQS